MKNPLYLAVPAILIVGALIFFAAKSSQSQPQDQTVAKSPKQQDKTIPGYQGNVLAGTTSPYLQFTKADYQKALSENKIILLDFYANWCPICRSESPHLKSGFDGLTTDKVVGFRVNFNDSDTDDDEKMLASEFDIPYQHTKVLLKNGQEVKRSGQKWDQQTFDQEINQISQSN